MEWHVMDVNTLHVVPAGDVVGHESDARCVCQPTPEPVIIQDSTEVGRVWIHHSLDGRELNE